MFFDRITKAFWAAFSQRDGTGKEDEVLKLKAQEFTAFSGRFDDWANWKAQARCVINANKWTRVFEDRVYALSQPALNSLIYSRLALALVDGHAEHVILPFESTNDGHGAWGALLTWYESSDMQYDLADKLRQQLTDLKLRPGGSAQEYINKFMVAVNRLNRIQGETMSEVHQVQAFLRGIEDEDYSLVRSLCRNQQLTLLQSTARLTSEERELLLRRKAKRKFERPRRAAQPVTPDDSSSNKRQRHGDERASDEWNGKWDHTLRTKPGGIISVPRDLWNSDLFTEEYQEYVRDQNSRARHNDKPEDVPVPEGLTVIRRRPAPPRHVEPAGEKESTATGKQIKFNLHGDSRDSSKNTNNN